MNDKKETCIQTISETLKQIKEILKQIKERLEEGITTYPSKY